MSKLYLLKDKFNQSYLSEIPGAYGGHKKHKIFGRLDCKSARAWIERGEYVDYRVFFADQNTAILAGYRPCGHCMKDDYLMWKNDPEAYISKILNQN